MRGAKDHVMARPLNTLKRENLIDLVGLVSAACLANSKNN
jgi:hypothetical protein